MIRPGLLRLLALVTLVCTPGLAAQQDTVSAVPPADSAATALAGACARGFPRHRALHALPVLFSGPSTGVGFGASALLLATPRCDTLTRPTQLGVVVLYTTKQQIDAIVQFDAWQRGNRSRVFLQAEIQNFPSSFFGVGNNDPDTAPIEFNLQAFNLQARYQQRLAPDFFASLGVGAHLSQITGLPRARRGAPDTLFGIRGSRTAYVEGTLQHDSRDNVLTPGRGHWITLRTQVATPVFTSRFTFVDVLLDARGYIPLPRRRVLALQGSIEGIAGRTPFELLPNFGGPNDLRAYPVSRFRDNVAVILQAELRTPLIGRFGAVVFAGAGMVAKRLSALDPGDLRPSVGAGLRYRLFRKQNANVRVDVGVGQGSRAVYIGFGEAF